MINKSFVHLFKGGGAGQRPGLRQRDPCEGLFFCAPLGPCGRLLAAGLRFFRSIQQKRKVSFLMSAFCLAVNFCFDRVAAHAGCCAAVGGVGAWHSMCQACGCGATLLRV